ncbi:MAG: hypothetical protein B7X38_06670 [Stenotrophomonas sp. 14-69-23]|nr:MAG: hypothetical protein B7X38_06670 [Stenotrophomonas sp. 14-69-23]
MRPPKMPSWLRASAICSFSRDTTFSFTSGMSQARSPLAERFLRTGTKMAARIEIRTTRHHKPMIHSSAVFHHARLPLRIFRFLSLNSAVVISP